jgi:hypothetical protein
MIRNNTSSLNLNTGAPQGCMLNPLLYSHNCVAKHPSNSILKFADDTTVVGLITNNDETADREEVRARSVVPGNLSLNKTKELIVDFRKQQREHAPLHIFGSGEVIKLQVPRTSSLTS